MTAAYAFNALFLKDFVKLTSGATVAVQTKYFVILRPVVSNGLAHTLCDFAGCKVPLSGQASDLHMRPAIRPDYGNRFARHRTASDYQSVIPRNDGLLFRSCRPRRDCCHERYRAHLQNALVSAPTASPRAFAPRYPP